MQRKTNRSSRVKVVVWFVSWVQKALPKLTMTVRFAMFMEKKQLVIRWYGETYDFLMKDATMFIMMMFTERATVFSEWQDNAGLREDYRELTIQYDVSLSAFSRNFSIISSWFFVWKLNYRKLYASWVPKYLRNNTKWIGESVHWFFGHDSESKETS